MIEFARELDVELGVPQDGVVIDRDAAVGGNELAGFGERERIDLQRARFDVGAA